MEQHTKDEINFRGFLTAYRTMQGVEMQALTKGLYSKSMMSRVESGERLPKKLERDRLVARLGVSGEGYEDYLSREEYAEWRLRQEILESIEEKNIAKLEEQLEIYASTEGLDKVECQFLEAMRFMLLKMKGAPENELRKTIELAVSYTIEDIEDGFPENLILADQEINLLIEYVSLHQYGNGKKACREWRFARYNDIIAYIEKSYIDNIGKAKVFTKLVYYICKEYMNDDSSTEELEYCLELCNEAIEVLRAARKMYYFVELLEMRKWLLEHIGEITCLENQLNGPGLQVLKRNTNDWLNALVALYNKYEVSPYMDDFCYLYWETESHSVNKVIRIRRKMLKITQVTLAGEVCDIKTVRRTEQEKMSPQMYAVRGMFGNLGLCPEYIRTRVISNGAEAFKLHMKVARYSNSRETDKWETCIEELESALCMDIVQNKQAVMREKVLLDSHTKMVSRDETIARLEEVLALTMPPEKMFKAKEWYFTIEELSLLYNIAVRINVKKKNKYMDLLRKYCDKEMVEGRFSCRTDVQELLITGIANYLGDMGLYNESNAYGDIMIRQGLKHKRMHSLAKNLYNNCWNKYNVNGGPSLARESAEVDIVLHQCIHISEIMNDTMFVEFFKKKLGD